MSSEAMFTASTDAFFIASHDAQFASMGIIDGLKRIVLRGVCIDTSVNRNGWQVPEDELHTLAEKSINAQIRIDHSASIREVKGRILKAEVDEPHQEAKEEWDLSNPLPHIHYEAEIITNDANIIIPVINGYVDHVSIGLDSKSVFCSECGESVRPTKTCDCVGGWEIIRNARVNEYSIVSSPAYDGTAFKPYAAAEKKKKCNDDEDNIEIDKNQEISSEEKASEEIKEEVDTMVDDEKFDSLIAMVTELANSNKELIASNNNLLTRIASIEKAEEEEEEKKACSSGKKAKKEDEEEEEKEASEEEASDEEDGEEEEEEEKPKKASKKKASNGMKPTPGERGDPPGEGKKEIKKTPIEAGVIVKDNKLNATVEGDVMGKAVGEIFGFAAKLNIYPLEG